VTGRGKSGFTGFIQRDTKCAPPPGHRGAGSWRPAFTIKGSDADADGSCGIYGHPEGVHAVRVAKC